MASGIIGIELAYVIPLLALNYVNGNNRIVIDQSRPVFTNVNIILYTTNIDSIRPYIYIIIL